MPNDLTTGEPLPVEHRGRADRACRGHGGTESGRRRGVGDRAGDQAEFRCARPRPFPHLHDRAQAFEHGAMPAERGVPGGAQRLDGGRAAKIKAVFGLALGGPRRWQWDRGVMLEVTSSGVAVGGAASAGAGIGAGPGAESGGGAARAAFSTRAIEPVTPSTFCSRVAMRPISCSWRPWASGSGGCRQRPRAGGRGRLQWCRRKGR